MEKEADPAKEDIGLHSYPGLSHGFGLGTGTAAEGWIDEAIAFWKRQVQHEDVSY